MALGERILLCLSSTKGLTEQFVSMQSSWLQDCKNNDSITNSGYLHRIMQSTISVRSRYDSSISLSYVHLWYFRVFFPAPLSNSRTIGYHLSAFLRLFYQSLRLLESGSTSAGCQRTDRIRCSSNFPWLLVFPSVNSIVRSTHSDVTQRSRRMVEQTRAAATFTKCSFVPQPRTSTDQWLQPTETNRTRNLTVRRTTVRKKTTMVRISFNPPALENLWKLIVSCSIEGASSSTPSSDYSRTTWTQTTSSSSSSRSVSEVIDEIIRILSQNNASVARGSDSQSNFAMRNQSQYQDSTVQLLASLLVATAGGSPVNTPQQQNPRIDDATALIAALLSPQRENSQPQSLQAPTHTAMQMGLGQVANLPSSNNISNLPHGWLMQYLLQQSNAAPPPQMTPQDLLNTLTLYLQNTQQSPAQQSPAQMSQQLQNPFLVAANPMAINQRNRYSQAAPSDGSTSTAHGDQRAKKQKTHDARETLPRILSVSEDVDNLSAHQIFLRCQIEAFRATEEDVSTHTRGRNKPVVIGQIGIRCRHCSNIPVRRRQKGSTYFPATVLGLYQAAQNMCTIHMQCGLCSEMPLEVKNQFAQLLSTKVAGSGAGRPYWANAAIKLGLVDTPDGIRYSGDLKQAIPDVCK
eukprot:scaffold1442_cov128-Cylindrotheca_fusiformis.AAC.45